MFNLKVINYICVSQIKSLFIKRSINNFGTNVLLQKNKFSEYEGKTDENNDVKNLIDVENNLFNNDINNKQNNRTNTKTLLKPFNKLKSYLYTTKKESTSNKNFNLKLIESETFSNGKKIESNNNKSLITKKEKIKSEKFFDKELNLSYVNLHLNDPLLSTLMLATKSKKRRSQKLQLLMEGRRLIIDGILSGLQLEYLLFSNMEQLNLIKDHLHGIKNLNIIKVPYSDLKLWSNLTTCPGIMGLFTREHEQIDANLINDNNDEKLPITVICDKISEPNNLGSIIRVCASLPCKQIITLKGCTDPWDSKCLRGGCGGQFRISIKSSIEWNDLTNYLPDSYNIYIAENNIKRIDDMNNVDIQTYNNVTINKLMHTVVIIGGETHGISHEAYNFLKQNNVNNQMNRNSLLYIPLANGIESLNTSTALGILLFEIRKQLEN